MTGIQDISFERIPDEWEPKWFLDFIRDVLTNLDSRNALGVDIIVSGESDQVATYQVDSQNVDLAEGLETRALIGAIRQQQEEFVILLNAARIQHIGLMQRIEELEVDAA